MASSATAAGDDNQLKLKAFLSHVSKVADDDSRWTSATQIDRLLRPGAKYRNLNPYEVLQVPWDCEDKVIKKQFRKLSILLHPDKNRDNPEQAKQAFEAVNTAYQTLNDPEKMGWVNFVIDEAKESFPYLLAKRRKEAKKKDQKIPEDISQEQYNDSFRKHMIKMFADKEIERQTTVDREQREKRREAEEKEAEQAAKKAKVEYEKAWAKGRDARMEAWLSFEKQADGEKKKKKKKEKKMKGFRPPKHKMQKRE